MGTSRYAVACDLGLHHFDVPAAGRAMARAAYRESRRLGLADDAVVSTRWRRVDRLRVRLTVTVDAATPLEAYRLGAGLLRTGIHAVGGSTAGWERIEPCLHTRSSRRRRRTLRHDDLLPPPTWASSTAAARGRIDRCPALPPLRPC